MKKNQKSKLIKKMIGVVFLLVAIYFCVNIASQVLNMVSLKKQKAIVEEELQSLRDENDSLTSTKTKLEDPNYVTTFARGEYMFSKNNEKVFYLPSSNE